MRVAQHRAAEMTATNQVPDVSAELQNVLSSLATRMDTAVALLALTAFWGILVYLAAQFALT